MAAPNPPFVHGKVKKHETWWSLNETLQWFYDFIQVVAHFHALEAWKEGSWNAMASRPVWHNFDLGRPEKQTPIDLSWIQCIQNLFGSNLFSEWKQHALSTTNFQFAQWQPLICSPPCLSSARPETCTNMNNSDKPALITVAIQQDGSVIFLMSIQRTFLIPSLSAIAGSVLQLANHLQLSVHFRASEDTKHHSTNRCQFHFQLLDWYDWWLIPGDTTYSYISIDPQ